jgi:thymidine kinase
MSRIIQTQIHDSVEEKRQKVDLLIDEASFFRLEVFMEIQTLTQFQAHYNSLLPMIFVGQGNLANKFP